MKKGPLLAWSTNSLSTIFKNGNIFSGKITKMSYFIHHLHCTGIQKQSFSTQQKPTLTLDINKISGLNIHPFWLKNTKYHHRCSFSWISKHFCHSALDSQLGLAVWQLKIRRSIHKASQRFEALPQNPRLRWKTTKSWNESVHQIPSCPNCTSSTVPHK